jgi:hypothetical protein
MAASESALYREYILAWLEQLAGDVGFTVEAFEDMRREGLDLADVVSALETSDTITATKENPHDAFFSMVGTTCDGETLTVTISINPHMRGICVHQVRRM